MRLLYLVSHPIQYQAPLLRKIAARDGIELFVLFDHLDSLQGYQDPGFGQEISWDVPLTQGYDFAEVNSRRHLKHEIRKSDVLWVHGWDTALKRRALKVAKKAGVKTLMRGENTEAAMPDGSGLRGILKRFYLAQIFKSCDGFLSIGADNRTYYSSRGIEDHRLFSMPYTVDNDFFLSKIKEASVNRQTFRKQLGLASDAPVILFAGKLQNRKHPDVLLKSFKKLDREVAREPVLIYVGDGEQRKALEASAAELGRHVIFAGFKNQTELPAYYDLADVFVLAASKEPWGLGVNEAMVGGCVPVVTQECGCAADLIDEHSGRVVDPGDADQLAHALQELLSQPDALRAMGEAAQTKVLSWGLNESVAGLEQALNKLKASP